MLHSFQNISFRDEQTGLYSEAYFMEVFYREWHHMIREQLALSLLVVRPNLNLITEDGLKEYILLAQLLGDATKRQTDVVSRFHNNEFVVGLFNLDSEGTTAVIERIKASVEQKNGQLVHLNRVLIGAMNVAPGRETDINTIFNQVMAIDAASHSGAKNEKISYQLQAYS
ncbi:MAG: PleD family two-component response regulator [Phenylobacterium sp.]